MIMLRVMRDGKECFNTPVASPEVVVGMLSCLVAPGNENVTLHVGLETLNVPKNENAEKNN